MLLHVQHHSKRTLITLKTINDDLQGTDCWGVRWEESPGCRAAEMIPFLNLWQRPRRVKVLQASSWWSSKSNYLIYLTLFKVERGASFHSIWPVDAPGGLWNHNSVIARSNLDLISYNLLYAPVQPARFISAHLYFFFFFFLSLCWNYIHMSELFMSLPLSLCGGKFKWFFVGKKPTLYFRSF